MGATDLLSTGVKVAMDTGPLHGPRTGIGNAVAWTLDALAHQANLELLPYEIGRAHV